MQARSERIAAITYAAALAAALLFVSAIVAAPLLEATRDSGDVERGSLIYLAYSRVCHQLANRSFQIEGHPFAVCSRCTGIYAGYVMGLVVYPFVRSLARTETPARTWLLVAMAPVAIDLAGDFAGLFDNTLLSRALTGGVAGAAGAFYTLPGLASLALTVSRTPEEEYSGR
ncbi:MAG TPA: DUF2085 domain-containing protein [Blastocatellia bacterium]|nr:DUF2085 domain-containing protein [Blastocatellia bacterium]